MTTTSDDAPRAGGETPSEATLAEIRKGVEDARDGRVVDRGSFAAHASETPETRVDNLLRDFQNACEMVVVLGDSNLSETTKLRAVLRNQLRASLLARHRDGERSAEAARIDARFISEVRRAFNAAGHTAAGFEFRVAAALQDLNEARAKLLPIDGPKVIQSAGPSPERASK